MVRLKEKNRHHVWDVMEHPVKNERKRETGKRALALLMAAAMLFLLCACGNSDAVLQQTKQAMAKRDSYREVRDIYVMRYTDRASLTDNKLERNSGVYDWIPRSGTVIVLEGKEDLYDYEIFFFSESGILALSEDVMEFQREHDRIYSKPNKDWIDYENFLNCIDLVQYFGGIGINAERQVLYAEGYKDSKGVPGRMKDDTWYMLSKDQLKSVR